MRRPVGKLTGAIENSATKPCPRHDYQCDCFVSVPSRFMLHLNVVTLKAMIRSVSFACHVTDRGPFPFHHVERRSLYHAESHFYHRLLPSLTTSKVVWS